MLNIILAPALRILKGERLEMGNLGKTRYIHQALGCKNKENVWMKSLYDRTEQDKIEMVSISHAWKK